ncbi:peptidyl-prolyl cis-trans isomerase [Fulvitalea axinellae]|uniref:peptidylprolyl isomerase n=1 Tax=Fulvitalea axinellae TaxID=1182444 RepID=A0AAU9D2M4_9BACT|nr:peptidyl-prolyl cis-trans isomerase [Fulvitalea axinellae]
MRLKNFFTLAAASAIALSFSSCGKKYEKSADGYEFHYNTKGDKKLELQDKVLVGQIQIVNLSQGDTVLFSTLGEDQFPYYFRHDSASMSKDFMGRMLMTLSMGDSVDFKVSADSLSNPRPLPPNWNIKPGDFLGMTVSIDKVFDQEEFQEFGKEKQAEVMEARKRKAEADAEKQKIEDNEKIEKYLKENNITAKKTESGIHYVITEEGTGENAQANDMVTVHYVGNVLGGDYFDTSREDVAKEKELYQEGRDYSKPFQFQLGVGQVIPGWDEGIALLKKGGKATLYLPSGMAYGPRAAGAKIPANSVLIFEVELVDLQKPETL